MKKYTWSFSYVAQDEDTARESFKFDILAGDTPLYEEIPKEEELTPEELKLENEEEDEMPTGN